MMMMKMGIRVKQRDYLRDAERERLAAASVLTDSLSLTHTRMTSPLHLHARPIQERPAPLLSANQKSGRCVTDATRDITSSHAHISKSDFK